MPHADDDDFHVVRVADFCADELVLHGDDNFRTPRALPGERVPIILFPEAVVRDATSVGGKSYLTLACADREAFGRFGAWVRSTCTDPRAQCRGPLLDAHQGEHGGDADRRAEATTAGADALVRVRLPPDDTQRFGAVTSGCQVRCAVEIPCVWRKGDEYGASLQVVQCVVTQRPACRIVCDL